MESYSDCKGLEAGANWMRPVDVHGEDTTEGLISEHPP